MVHTRLRFGDS